MAFVPSLRFSRKPIKKLLPGGYLKFPTGSFRFRQCSQKEDAPFKYIGSKVAHKSISDNLNLTSPYYLWYRSYVLGTSFVVFCLYFFVLREESDIDEMLKDGSKNNQYAELIDLKFKISYCIKHNLPHQNLVARMNEIKKNLGINDE